jgi:hypothetical protein
MTVRSAMAIAICSVALVQFTVIPSQAAPNGHANEHAQANAGGGGGDNGGGGKAGDSGNGGGKGGGGGGSVVHKFVSSKGLKQGDVSSALKSWNALNANPRAFANNLDNPNSLLGKQAAYICANSASEMALAEFETLAPSGVPPTADEVTAASDFLDALDRLTQANLSADTVLLTPASYTTEQVNDATLVSESGLTLETAQATLDANAAWTDYQAAAQLADDAFVVASVSYDGTSDLTELRATVDAIVEQKYPDTATLCGSTTEPTL